MSEALTTAAPVELAVHGRPTIDLAALFSLAIERGLGVDGMERLMKMRQELEAEAAQKAYVDALAKFQQECPVIAKPRSVTNRDGSHRYNFAPLDFIIKKVRDLLEQHGFSYSFDSITSGTMVKAICTVTHRDGHSKASNFEAPTDAAPGMNKMQTYASALSYAKRYAFCGAFGIQTGEEDDDAQGTVPDGPAQRRMDRIRAMRDQELAKDAVIVNHSTDEGERQPITTVPQTLGNELTDFLLSVADASEPDDLTQKAGEANALQDATHQKTAKRAIMSRATALGLKWSGNAFVRKEGQAA